MLLKLPEPDVRELLEDLAAELGLQRAAARARRP